MDGGSDCEEIRDSREVFDLYSYIYMLHIYIHIYIYIYVYYLSNSLIFLLNKVHYIIVYRVKI